MKIVILTRGNANAASLDQGCLEDHNHELIQQVIAIMRWRLKNWRKFFSPKHDLNCGPLEPKANEPLISWPHFEWCFKQGRVCPYGQKENLVIGKEHFRNTFKALSIGNSQSSVHNVGKRKPTESISLSTLSFSYNVEKQYSRAFSYWTCPVTEWSNHVQ